MPGIDFHRLRREIPMEDVLHLIGFQPCQTTGDQWYGGCPLHGSTVDCQVSDYLIPGRELVEPSVSE
jgi:hypothetical protein